MIVADCSVLVSLALTRDVSPEEIEILLSAKTVATPDYLQIELLSSCRRLVVAGLLEEREALRKLAELDDLPMASFDTASLKGEILGMRNNFTAYDAGYVALAQVLNLPLMTHDLRLRRAVAAHTTVQLI